MIAGTGAAVIVAPLAEGAIVGNAVGFVVVGVYFVTDWLIGDEGEEGIRRSLGQYRCTNGVGRR
jgi:hypothetical protein